MTDQLADHAAESAVVGSLLRDPHAYLDLPPSFASEAITHPTLRQVFRAATAIGATGDLPTAYSVRRRMESEGPLAQDQLLTLDALSDRPALTAAEFAHATDRILELCRRRAYTRIGTNLAHRAADLRHGLSDLEAEHERALLAIDATAEPETVSAHTTAAEYHAQVRELLAGGTPAGLPLGIQPLDNRLKVNPTDLVLLGGRPANGKSILALQIARAVAGAGKTVLFVGLEMHRSELHRRLLRAECSLEREAVLKPVSTHDYARATSANERLAKLPIEYASNPDLDVILRTAARLRRRKGLGLLIVDYVQRLRIPSHGMNRDQALGEAASRLKDFSARFEVPVIAVAALSREASRRDDPRPRLEDLRESGRLEYEANSVVFVHVPCRVMGTPENLALRDALVPTARKREARQKAELILAKQRDAEDLVVIPVRAEFEFTRFDFTDIGAGDEEGQPWREHTAKYHRRGA